MALSLLKIYVFILLVSLCVESKTKSTDSEESNERIMESKHKTNDGAALMFADEFKQILDKYLFGICPQSFKMQLGKGRNNVTALGCDVDSEHQELAGRLATLSLRAHAASRGDCSRFGAALANTLGELARTAANRAAISSANEANKKRKLSKSQKAKIQAKQRTALAVKKKAAAAAAAAAAKMAS